MINFIRSEGVFITGVIMLVLLIAIASYAPKQSTVATATSTPPQSSAVANTSQNQPAAPVKQQSVYASSTLPTTPPLLTKPSIRGGGESEQGDD